MAVDVPDWVDGTQPYRNATNLNKYTTATRALDTRVGVLELARFNVKSSTYGATGNGSTDDTTAINAAVTAAGTAGGGVVYFPPGTYVISAPIAGKDKVRFEGAGKTVTTLKAKSTFTPTVTDGGGLIQWQGAVYDSTPPGTIFTYVGVCDMTIDMSAAPDTVTNQINAIWQDYSQLRHCLIERVHYIGATNGQGILLNGLGRITGGNSYDITIRDISATNGAGTISLYLNAVTDATAQYHGVTIDNIWNEITTISGIVDDRVVIAGGHVSDAGSNATVHDIAISNVKVVIQTGATVSGLVNGIKIDTGKAVNIRNVTIRDTYMWGNGSTTVSGHPIITFLGAQTGTLGGLQDLLIDGVYAWHTCGVAVKWRRVDTAPSITVRNVHLNGAVTGSTGWPYGIMLYCLSTPVGDELVTVDGVTMDATSGSMNAIGLCSDTPTSGTAHGGSGQTVIKNVVAKSFVTGVTIAKDAAGSAASQSGWDNVVLQDILLVTYTTAFSALSKTYRARNVTGVADAQPVVALTDAATIATDASLGNLFRVTLGGNRTLGNPTNPANGQVATWELIQDGTGSRTLALDTQFALGTTISSTTLTTTASKRDFLTAVYNATATKWYVINFVKGY